MICCEVLGSCGPMHLHCTCGILLFMTQLWTSSETRAWKWLLLKWWNKIFLNCAKKFSGVITKVSNYLLVMKVRMQRIGHEMNFSPEGVCT